jgi:hypothetical protein
MPDKEQRKCVELPGPVPVAAPRDPGMRGLVAVGLAGEVFGLPVETAFLWAMCLQVHGTSVEDAVEAFMHAARWTQ